MSKKFDWHNVARSAIASGLGAGTSNFLGNTTVLEPILGAAGGWRHVAASAAIANGIGQRVNNSSGLSKEGFSWREMAASASTAVVGKFVGEGLSDKFASLGAFQPIAQKTLTGIASSTTSLIVNKGTVKLRDVAADAFGNALGSSLAEKNSATELTPSEIRNLDYDDPKMIDLRDRSGVNEMRAKNSAHAEKRIAEFHSSLTNEILDWQAPVDQNLI